MSEKSILEMANGAVGERADYEFAKIIDNIRDPNTDLKKVRELQIIVKCTTDADRRNIYTSYDVKPPKLAPTNPITTSLYITNTERGDMSIVELTPQVPGQIDMSGDTQAEPVLLRLVEGM